MASVKSIEINRPPTRLERLFEIIPGFTSWSFLFGLVLLSFWKPVAAAYIIIGYDLLWLIKSVGMSRRMIGGFRRVNSYQKYDWKRWLDQLDMLGSSKQAEDFEPTNKEERWFKELFDKYHKEHNQILKPKDVYNAVIIATYNESIDILEPTVKSVLESNYDPKHTILFIAYEERGGEDIKDNANALVAKYGKHFYHSEAVMHPADIPGEVIGKGGNITFAGRRLEQFVKDKNIPSDNVIVTTLDSDNRPHPNYLAYLTFVYCVIEDRKYKSFQPVPMFLNNIWDAPAPMRLIAVGNSFWMLIQSMRPHLMRNFSAHAQPLSALIDTDFWSVRTIVEDGHQYWRTYFRYDGRHDTLPLFVPVYQDAVLAETYIRTFKAQFIQLRRWSWGVTDISYVVYNSIKNKKIAFWDKINKIFRLFEGHFSWATAPIILAFAGWLPLLLNPESDRSIIAHQLPIIASRIQTIAALGILISITLTLLSLPPRPPHQRKSRSLGMIFQWVLIPVVGIFFGSAAALTSQTRLMFGWYLGKFDITEKAVHKRSKSN